MEVDSLTTLASRILRTVKAFYETLAQTGSKSDDIERYLEPSKELDGTRDSIINDCAKLISILEPPEAALGNIYLDACPEFLLAMYVSLLISQQVDRNSVGASHASLQNFRLPDIAEQSGVPEDLLFHFIRIGMVNGIFAEPFPRRVSHIARSRGFVRNSGLLDSIAFQCENLAPAAGRYIEAIEKWGSTDEPE